VSAEELQAIVRGRDDRATVLRWRALVDANLLVLCLMYFCVIYGLYFYLTWLPTYFREARGFTAAQAAGLSSLVLLTGGIATLAGGWWTDRLVARRGRRTARSIGAVTLPVSGIAFIVAARTSSPLLAAAMFAVATAGADASISVAWAICHDIGDTAAGTVTAVMNTFGNLGGALSPLVVGYALERTGSWSAPLIIGGVVYIVGGVLTFFINPHRVLLPPGDPIAVGAVP
jgi:predicted MFS family arabinose efflux permease